MKRHLLRQSVLAAICICTCFLLFGCASVERFSDRQQRRHHYAQLLRSLPERATRAQLYAVLPPLSKPVIPDIWSVRGMGPLATESYPVDADYEVVATFVYHHSRITDPRDPFSWHLVQSSSDYLFIGSLPSIQPRTP